MLLNDSIDMSLNSWSSNKESLINILLVQPRTIIARGVSCHTFTAAPLRHQSFGVCGCFVCLWVDEDGYSRHLATSAFGKVGKTGLICSLRIKNKID